MKGFLTSQRQHERLSQVPVGLRGNPHFLPKLRNTFRFPLPCKLRPDSPAVTPEHPHARPRNSNGDLTSLRQHERLHEFPMVPGEESQASRHNLRQTTRFPHQREMRPFSPAVPRELSSLSKLKSRLDSLRQLKGAQRSSSQLEMKAELPATTREEPRVTHLIWR